MFTSMSQSKGVVILTMVLLALFILGSHETLAQDGGDVDIQDIYLPGKGGPCGDPSNGGRWGATSKATLIADLEQFKVGPLFDAEQATGLQIGADCGRIFLQDRSPVDRDPQNDSSMTEIEVKASAETTPSLYYNASTAIVDGTQYHAIMGFEDVLENRVDLKLIADSEGDLTIAKVSLGFSQATHTVDPGEQMKTGKVAYFFLICEKGEIDLTDLIQYTLGCGWKADWLGVEVVGKDASGTLTKTTVVVKRVADLENEEFPGSDLDRVRVDVKKDLP